MPTSRASDGHPMAGPAPVTRVQPRLTGPHALHIGTFNIRSGTSLATFRRGVAGLRRHVDVAGLQEIGLNAKRRYLGSLRFWGSYHPPRHASDHYPAVATYRLRRARR